MGTHPLCLLRIKQVGVLVRCTQTLGASDEARAGWMQGIRSSNLERLLMPPPACWHPERRSCLPGGFMQPHSHLVWLNSKGVLYFFLYFLVIFLHCMVCGCGHIALCAGQPGDPTLSPRSGACSFPRAGGSDIFKIRKSAQFLVTSEIKIAHEHSSFTMYHGLSLGILSFILFGGQKN